MDTGRVIARRYLLQRFIQQGAACAIYQGVDQILQRAVTVKVATAEYVPMYRAALRATSQFSHPNIVGIYDLIVEPDTLYIVQEYVEGDDFGTLLQAQLTPYAVAELGIQICQALIYAGTPSRKICHGDLTPSAIIRDRRGLVRVNNFALPSDVQYFTAWSKVGGGNIVLSDTELPYGQASEGRKGDDVRATGLLLYQLLAGRSSDARSVEPPADGRLRFLRSVPPELCEVVARAIIRAHPQRITTAEALLAELKVIVEALEPASLAIAPEASYAGSPEVVSRAAPAVAQLSPGPGPIANPVAAMPAREGVAQEEIQPRRATSASLAAARDTALPVAPVVPDVSMKLAAARQAAYGQRPAETAHAQRVNVPLLLLFGLVLFGAFFGIGYWLALLLIH